jgi:uncharacterized protein with von Willebrand factor type A (vWA) domain
VLTNLVAHQTINSLNADIDKHLRFLQAEQFRADRLEKELSEQLKTHKNLVGALNKIPENLAKELQKDGGIASNVLETEQKVSNKYVATGSPAPY